MNCKKIQEIIVTDYVDEQMGDKQKSFIDHHLAHCQVCNNYLISIKGEVIVPFNNVHKAIPDEFLWVRLKQTIQGEQQQQLEKSLKPGFWEKVSSLVHVPKPAFVLATLVTMIFMIGTSGQLFINTQFVKINGPAQMEYVSSLIDEPADVVANEGNDTQTPIEKYFL